MTMERSGARPRYASITVEILASEGGCPDWFGSNVGSTAILSLARRARSCRGAADRPPQQHAISVKHDADQQHQPAVAMDAQKRNLPVRPEPGHHPQHRRADRHEPGDEHQPERELLARIKSRRALGCE